MVVKDVIERGRQSLAETIARYEGGVEGCGQFSTRKIKSKMFVNQAVPSDFDK